MNMFASLVFGFGAGLIVHKLVCGSVFPWWLVLMPWGLLGGAYALMFVLYYS